MKKLLLIPTLLPAFLFGQGCGNFGNGSDGALILTVDSTIVGGSYQFTSVNIPAGLTLSVIGTTPLEIRSTGNVIIDGSLTANGGNGTDGITYVSGGTGGIGVAGGGNGGDGSYSSSLGPLDGGNGLNTGAGGMGSGWSGGGGAGHATAGFASGSASGGFAGPSFGDINISSIEPGAGGGGGSGGYSCGSGGGGAGGGYISLFAPSISIGSSGIVSCKGGNGGSDGTGNCGGGGAGSGGAIWLVAQTLNNAGTVTVSGGIGGSSTVSGSPYYGTGGDGANGRIRLDFDSNTSSGTFFPAVGATFSPLSTLASSVSASISPCENTLNGEIELTTTGGTAPYNYLWNNGVTDSINTGLAGGNYSCTITDAVGCSVIVDFTLNSLATDSIVQSVSICSGEVYQIGNSSYSSTGIYTDVFQNVNGCDSIITTNLTVQAINPTINYVGNQLQASPSGAAQYQWYDCNNATILNQETNETFVPTSNGSFAVIVTLNNCIDTSACFVYDNTGLSVDQEKLVTIYPNPTDGIFSISFNGIDCEQLILTDFTGRTIKTISNIQTTDLYSLDLSKEADGTYFLKIQSKRLNYTYKVVKK